MINYKEDLATLIKCKAWQSAWHSFHLFWFSEWKLWKCWYGKKERNNLKIFWEMQLLVYVYSDLGGTNLLKFSTKRYSFLSIDKYRAAALYEWISSSDRSFLLSWSSHSADGHADSHSGGVKKARASVSVLGHRLLQPCSPTAFIHKQHILFSISLTHLSNY